MEKWGGSQYWPYSYNQNVNNADQHYQFAIGTLCINQSINRHRVVVHQFVSQCTLLTGSQSNGRTRIGSVRNVFVGDDAERTA